MDDPRTAMAQEWSTLQQGYERYESGALCIKLGAVLLMVAATALALDPFVGALAVLLLWLQEGIFKTFQSRLGQRLLRLEAWLAAPQEAPPGAAFQLHSDWVATRPGGARLVAEYLASACRPTVAFPYAVLLLVMIAQGV